MTKKVNLSQYSSIKIGPTIEVVLINEENFRQYYDSYIIGGCSNILPSNNLPKLVMLSKEYNYINIVNDTLDIGAATPNGKIVSFCKKNNIANFEFLAHLPGKLGGIIKMNAGLKDTEVFNYIQSVTINTHTFLKKDIDYGYRYTNIDGVIFSATFKIEHGYSKEKEQYFKQLRSNQPTLSSAGSCFKNPKNDYAGRLIEAVGYKGKRLGNMEFSSQHANFLVNHKEDTTRDNYQDAIKLIEGVKNKILQEYNITLEEEIIILKAKH